MKLGSHLATAWGAGARPSGMGTKKPRPGDAGRGASKVKRSFII